MTSSLYGNSLSSLPANLPSHPTADPKLPVPFRGPTARLQELSIPSSFLYLLLTLQPTPIWPLAASKTLVQLWFHFRESDHLLPT